LRSPTLRGWLKASGIVVIDDSFKGASAGVDEITCAEYKNEPGRNLTSL
jgi:hypothetical protein